MREAPAAGGETGDAEIVIELGDYDGIADLASKAQNFEVSEGTTAKITGLFNSGISTPSINEKGDGGYKGISMIIEGDFEAPADDTEIEAFGTFVKGQYYMEFHVNAEDITVK